MLWHFFGSLNPCFPQVLWWFCLYICHLFLKILALKVHKLSWGLYFWGLCLTHWDSHEALPCQEEPVEDPELCSLSRHLLLALIWVEIHLFQWIWVWRNRTTAGARAGVCRAGKYSPPSAVTLGSIAPGYSWSSSGSRFKPLKIDENFMCKSPITVGSAWGSLCPFFGGGPCAHPVTAAGLGRFKQPLYLFWDGKDGKAEWWCQQGVGALQWSLLRDVMAANWIP